MDDSMAVMLSTIDNPYNPFTQFDEWYQFDVKKGYHSCSYLARVAKADDELSELDDRISIEKAIDEIVELNVLGIYIKVTPDSFIKRKDIEKNSK